MNEMEAVKKSQNSSKMGPRMLMPPQKQLRIDASKHFLKLYSERPTPVLEQILTGDET